MSTTIRAGENATGTDRRIDHDRYERAICESMTVSAFAPGMKTVTHDGTRHDVDLESGMCGCADARYRPDTYCKHAIAAALVAIYADGVRTAFVAQVARYATAQGCPKHREWCDGPVGRGTYPCPTCIASTGASNWTVWCRLIKQTEAPQ